MRIQGKALLVIEKLDSQWVPYDVTAHIQACEGDWQAWSWAEEDFQHLDTDTLPLPIDGRKLAVGERVWVHVVFSFWSSKDYYGEIDVALEYHKVRVLKRTPPRKARY